MKVIIRVETIADWGETDVVEIYQFERPIGELSPETVGLSLADGKSKERLEETKKVYEPLTTWLGENALKDQVHTF